MELCINNGFRVMSQTQVHRRNLHTLFHTAQRLNDMGVGTLRLIRTTEVSRWTENAPGSCLDIEEYFAEMLKFMSAYKDSGMTMNVVIWQFMKAYPKKREYKMEAVLCPDGKFKLTAPVCKGNRGMIGVTSGGEVVPCLQMSGYFEEHGIHLGNLHETPLNVLLTESDYLNAVCADLRRQLKNNPKCAACRYFKYCNGGCPALGLLMTGDPLGEDISKCLFYENGWYEKVVRTMEGWKNLSRIEEFETVHA